MGFDPASVRRVPDLPVRRPGGRRRRERRRQGGDRDRSGEGSLDGAPGLRRHALQADRALLPFTNAIWWNGAFVATGDTNGDGRAEIVDGLDAGCCTTIHVVDAQDAARRSAAASIPPAQQTRPGRGSRPPISTVTERPRSWPCPSAAAGSAPSGRRAASRSGRTRLSADETARWRGDRSRRRRRHRRGPSWSRPRTPPGGVQVKMIDTRDRRRRSRRSSPTASARRRDAAGRGRRRRTATAAATSSSPHSSPTVLRCGHSTRTAASSARSSCSSPGSCRERRSPSATSTATARPRSCSAAAQRPTAPWPPVANGADQRVVVYRLRRHARRRLHRLPGPLPGRRPRRARRRRAQRPARLITAPGPGMEPEIGIFSQRWLATRDRGTRTRPLPRVRAAVHRGRQRGGRLLGRHPEDRDRTGAGPPARGPRLRLRRGRLLSSFLAFEPSYTGRPQRRRRRSRRRRKPEIVVGTLAPPARIRAFELDGHAVRGR